MVRTLWKTLGQRIRELREKQDLSLRAFAKKLGGLSAPFLSDVELGRRYPSDKVLANMASVLGTTVQDLQKFDSRPPIEDIKRLSYEDPAFGFALRALIKTNVSPDDLLELAKKRGNWRER